MTDINCLPKGGFQTTFIMTYHAENDIKWPFK